MLKLCSYLALLHPQKNDKWPLLGDYADCGTRPTGPGAGADNNMDYNGVIKLLGGKEDAKYHHANYMDSNINAYGKCSCPDGSHYRVAAFKYGGAASTTGTFKQTGNKNLENLIGKSRSSVWKIEFMLGNANYNGIDSGYGWRLEAYNNAQSDPVLKYEGLEYINSYQFTWDAQDAKEYADDLTHIKLFVNTVSPGESLQLYSVRITSEFTARSWFFPVKVRQKLVHISYTSSPHRTSATVELF
eukprot:SAG31_NODE_4761_length_2973_cov_2.001740_2_plen_244_part_00